MSTTRHATDDSVYRQERYASSPEYQKGLQANLVAKRCKVLTAPADRELIYFLQLISHREGGLKQLAADLIASFPERIATKSMQVFGIKTGKIYSAEQVRTLRMEFPDPGSSSEYVEPFPLKGDRQRHSGPPIIRADNVCWQYLSSAEKEKMSERLEKENERQSKLPTSYPAQTLLNICREIADANLERDISDLCLDPEWNLSESRPWYFPGLVETLREYQSDWIEEKRASLVTTELCEKVFETLDYCLDCRRLTMMRGLDRTGKTFSAKVWCELHPGQARFVEVPPGSDDRGFFRAIAEALGIGTNLNSKAHDLRDRIEYVLHTGNLMLVFDEAHYLWPQSNYRDALPFRISWIMSLANRAVPTSLIITQQFFDGEKRLERRAGWNSGQFFGRNFHCESLPEILSEKDLTAIAKAFLPEGDSRSISSLIDYAQSSAKYLAGIEIAVTRARFLARKDGGEKVKSSDIARAILEGTIPSDAIINRAMAQPEKRNRSHTKRVIPMEAPRRTDLISETETIPTREPQSLVIQ